MGTIGAIEVVGVLIGGLIGRYITKTASACPDGCPDCTPEERAQAVKMIDAQIADLEALRANFA